ncbi:dihydrodipicolinate synthase family protein [Paracoccus caeni]|uniref:Dihydrodipicolinate synthase family protein n=1 Tax=Paracoccus caeni TaxID=657651 RepID=A0A934SMN6_9RHOB|nr:dihydrodipicolinate synthase family protein [Paracoccus caeni]MBK4217894.1 dihydrodipicolinate synthase family protein [Paracoccus caeni]
MTKLMGKDLHGLTVATVLPFHADLSIDWEGYDAVLDYCAIPGSIAAVLVNGHAGEGGALSDDERREVIRRTRARIRAKPLLAGVIAHSTTDAIAQAKLAEAEGADCAVIFPPIPLGGGASLTARAPGAYIRAIAEAISIPVSLFQYPVTSGLGYGTEVLAELATIPQVIAVKEGSDTILAYDENCRALAKAAPDVAVLASNYNWFLPQLAIGCQGILSGLISLVPGLFADLWAAHRAGDLAALRRANDRLYPVVRAIYHEAPVMDMHTRMKTGLKAMGIIAHDHPRAPLMPILPEVEARILAGLEQIGLLRQEA